jgi:hypothetical protein
MNRKPSQVQEHAFSRYMNLTVGVIEKLQQDYFAGRDLGCSVPNIDADTAAIIVAESLEADRIWNLPPKRLLSGEFGKGKRSDFKRAALAEILFGVVDVARENARQAAGARLVGTGPGGNSAGDARTATMKIKSATLTRPRPLLN